MDILVCIKQVPQSNNVEVDPKTGVLKREGTASKLNPYDLFSVEMALQLRARYGGSVKTVTMGPYQAEAAIMETLQMGVDSGTVISDRKFAGADVLATSYTLFQGIKKTGLFDLIICGKQTTDGDTAQVGSEIAEFMGIPHVANVEDVLTKNEDSITVRCRQDEYIVTQTIKLPCLICTDSEINTPRLPSYRRRKTITEKNVSFLSLSDMEDTDELHYGLHGSPTQVVRIFPPEKSVKKEVWTGECAILAERLTSLLRSYKFI